LNYAITPRFAITGVNAAIDRAASELSLFSELDLTWANPASG